MELALNIVLIALVGIPIVLLEFLRDYSDWIDRNHEGISMLLWLFLVAAVVPLVATWLGMEPNPRILERLP